MMKDTIEKLKEEKKEIMAKWEKEGFEWGQHWVNHASFPELEQYEQNLPELKQRGQLWPDEDVRSEYIANHVDEEDWCNSAHDGFWKGFANGFQVSWNEIKKAV